MPRTDTLKLYTRAHGAKVPHPSSLLVSLCSEWRSEIGSLVEVKQTTNLIINFENDEDWLLRDDGATLATLGMGSRAPAACLVACFERELRICDCRARAQRTRRKCRSSIWKSMKSSSSTRSKSGNGSGPSFQGNRSNNVPTRVTSGANVYKPDAEAS